MRDEVFKTKPSKQFEFDAEVVSVFDDMISRSIPYYEEQLNLISHFASLYLPSGGRVYDVGSSTGNTLFELYLKVSGVKMIGIDNSLAMIERSRLKAQAYGYPIEFVCEDFLEYDLLPCNVVLANYAMQFVRPMMRQAMLDKIYQALDSGGVFLMSEKVLSGDKVLERQMIERYYTYKASKGYSQSEITQKREALENVLIPYTQEENYQMLYKAGFKSVEILFKWVNFAIFLAKKEE